MYQIPLVLEGGGMRGLFTCGVLDWFMDHRIAFSEVYGVSAGAGHAASYLSCQRGRARRVSINYLKDERYCGIRSLLKTGDLFGADFIYKTIPEKLDHFDYGTFDTNPARLYAVCSHLESGRALYIPVRDSLHDMIYIRASASLPLVSRIVDTPRGKLLDGGVCDSVPVERALKTADRCVVVLTQPRGYRKKPSSMMAAVRAVYHDYPRFVKAYENRADHYNRTMEKIEALEASGRIFVIRPRRDAGFSRIEKDPVKLKALYAEGWGITESRGKALLSWLEQ